MDWFQILEYAAAGAEFVSLWLRAAMADRIGTVAAYGYHADAPPLMMAHGWMAMFAPDKRRTQSVRCTDDGTILKISEARALQAYTDNPEFGLYLTRKMVARLLANAERDPQPMAA